MKSFKSTLDNVKKRIRNEKSNEMLPVSPEKQKMIFDAVNLDTNNTCNQRCRFCFTHFDEPKTNMDIETFESILKVLPYVKDYAGGGYGFYFSCIYEPTINPNFIQYLSLLPTIAKDKCFLTTNLARPMDKEFIENMISANIHLINISIESLKEDKFEYITQNKKFDIYKKNLQLLEEVINEKGNNIPKFRFITILLNENKDEIIDLIEYCHTHFPLESYEVRTPYINFYENMEWNKKQYMSKKETEEIIEKLQSLDFHVDINIDSVNDLEYFYEQKEKNTNDNLEEDIYTEASKRLDAVEDYEYLFLRINPDGTCEDKKTNIKEKIPITKTEDYFKQKLFDLYENKAHAAYCSNYEEKNVIDGESFILMDKITENDAIIELAGWCCPDRKVNINKLIIKLTGSNGDVQYYHTSTQKRPDADAFKEKEEGWCGGFATYIAKSKLKDKNYIIDFLFKDFTGNTISYRWNYSLKIE